MACTGLLRLIPILALLSFGCSTEGPLLGWLSTAPPDLEVADGATRATLVGRELAALGRPVLVHEPVAGRVTLLWGAPLAAVLATQRAANAGESTVLRCLDGYYVTLPEVAVQPQSPWLVWAGWGGGPFEATDAQGKTVALGPYYLVWDVTDAGAERPWPYQVHRLERVARSVYEAITPPTSAAPAVQAGFALYEGHCAKCHALGGVGGDLGPELNCPTNVTQYWQGDWLARWIADPATLRRGARMPATGLAPPEVAAVIAYLSYAATAFKCP